MKNIYRKNLQAFYDTDVVRRRNKEMPAWKREERAHFGEMVLRNGKSSRSLEIGAGTGRDAAYYAVRGFEVVAIDVSEQMVLSCQEIGIEAHCMDVLNLSFEPNYFDAVYAMNSLLHIPHQLLPTALQQIKRVLKPKGYLYYGVYGGKRFEGIHKDDWAAIKRFFNYYPDHQIKQIVGEVFELVEFRPISLNQPYHFQSMIWQKPA